MAGASQTGFHLVNTKIKVEGADGDILFSHLMINQALADVNSFSFTWRQPQGEATLQSHITFYQKNLSKEVTINIQDNFTFKGLITGIDCLKQDFLGTQYEIKGKGLFAKLDEAAECNSFIKKPLKQIFTDLNTAQGLTLTLTPKNSKPLFYTVQYNQTAFEFYQLMAARYGEWLYYDGKALIMGPPSKDAVTLKIDQDVNDITISAEVRKGSVNGVGFDTYKGEALANKKGAPPASSSGLVAASMKGGESMYGSNQTGINMPHAANKEILGDFVTLQQQAAAAGTVYISAHSYNSKVKVGGRIKLNDESGKAAGEYIVTEIQHFCTNDNNYENQFVAVPAEIEVPPYTNPYLFTECKAQPALVTDNVDKDGLDRIKVRFPWQKTSESTPWLSVLTPHAGKDKGLRFLPEVGEEVLIGFIDNNAERPFMLGAVHTEKNKSSYAEAGNNLKSIGTRTGRRLELNDDSGIMLLYDNYTDKNPNNSLKFERKDKTEISVKSQKDANNYSVVTLSNADFLNIGVMSGGALVTEIRLEKAGKKITVKSGGSIELNAEQSIKLSAMNIEISASQELKLSGTAKGVDVKGMKVAVQADTTMDVKGLKTTVEGSAKLDLNGGALASLAGAIVKIN